MEQTTSSLKTYIIDTNVLLGDGSALFSFAEHDVIIPLTVIEELDRHKDRQDDVGKNARAFARKVAELQLVSTAGERYYWLNEKAKLFIMSLHDLGVTEKSIPMELDDRGDNQILAFCIAYKNKYQDKKTILVTRDTLLRIKGKVFSIQCEDYRHDKPVEKSELLYPGHITVEVEDIPDEAYKGGWQLDSETSKAWDLHPNECLTLKASKQKSALCRYVHDQYGGTLVPVKTKEDFPGKLKPRNKEQQFALDMLFDPAIQLMTLSGLAGTGKTILAIHAGLEQVLGTKQYKNLIVCRPVQPVGNDLGYLPGSIAEKMEPWLSPIKDNLRHLISMGSSVKHGNKKQDDQTLEYYFEEGIIEVQALTYIRGRSIPSAFLVIDESQNLTHHELKTILTRAGEGTKIVLTGDVEQIDKPYIDSVSNGLSITIERFKDSPIAGHISLQKGERSKLASTAAELL